MVVVAAESFVLFLKFRFTETNLNVKEMTFVLPSINNTVNPSERSGHVAVHFDGYIVVWGGYHSVCIANELPHSVPT